MLEVSQSFWTGQPLDPNTPPPSRKREVNGHAAAMRENGRMSGLSDVPEQTLDRRSQAGWTPVISGSNENISHPINMPDCSGIIAAIGGKVSSYIFLSHPPKDKSANDSLLSHKSALQWFNSTISRPQPLVLRRYIRYGRCSPWHEMCLWSIPCARL